MDSHTQFGMISLSGPGQAKAFGQHFTISSSDQTLFYADEKEAIVGTGKLRVTGTFGHFVSTDHSKCKITYYINY